MSGLEFKSMAHIAKHYRRLSQKEYTRAERCKSPREKSLAEAMALTWERAAQVVDDATINPEIKDAET